MVFGTQKIGDIFPHKIALWCDVVLRTEGCRRFQMKNTANFLRCKEVIGALFTVAVGILSTVKAAFWIFQFSQHVGGGFICYSQIKGRFCLIVTLAVRHEQQGIVIEHFFKMGNKPLIVGCVSAEAAANVVKNAAQIHLG